MKVLITGAGGFIGRHLVHDQLARGRQVTALDLDLRALEAHTADQGLDLVESDFRDSSLDSLLGDHDVCFHLASLHLEVGVPESEFQAVNVTGARELVERCRSAGIGRFVHCSSVGVFGDVQNPPADEGSDCSPDLAYERSKLAGERAVLEYAQQSGYPVVVVRPAWVYGPGCPRTLKLARNIRSGRFFYVGDGVNLRHPIHVQDMTAGFELAATHPDASGQVFIMAGPAAVTVHELVETIASSLGASPPRLRLPRAVAWLGGIAMETAFGLLGKQPPFSRRSLKFFSGNTAFRIEKARRILGFEPQVGLTDGIRSTLKDLEQAGYL